MMGFLNSGSNVPARPSQRMGSYDTAIERSQVGIDDVVDVNLLDEDSNSKEKDLRLSSSFPDFQSMDVMQAHLANSKSNVSQNASSKHLDPSKVSVRKRFNELHSQYKQFSKSSPSSEPYPESTEHNSPSPFHSLEGSQSPTLDAPSSPATAPEPTPVIQKNYQEKEDFLLCCLSPTGKKNFTKRWVVLEETALLCYITEDSKEILANVRNETKIYCLTAIVK